MGAGFTFRLAVGLARPREGVTKGYISLLSCFSSSSWGGEGGMKRGIKGIQTVSLFLSDTV